MGSPPLTVQRFSDLWDIRTSFAMDEFVEAYYQLFLVNVAPRFDAKF